jgi:hypothetical protein
MYEHQLYEPSEQSPSLINGTLVIKNKGERERKRERKIKLLNTHMSIVRIMKIKG